MADPAPAYRGRFAPSPTGPMHLGSLIAALASYLDARSRDGTWLVRMDDLDPPREQAGAASSILHCLKAHGLHWDEAVTWQSQRGNSYEAALATLAEKKQTFLCNCSRKRLGPEGSCGANCQSHQSTVLAPAATRIKVKNSSSISFQDLIRGPQSLELAESVADFVVKRKDGLYAYQLAVVVDDAAAGINRIVRGSDLMGSTARQIYMQQVLGFPTPDYAHLPVITNSQGQKYSKQNHAPALKESRANENLRRALSFLGQPTPPLELNAPEAILSFACRGWSMGLVKPVAAIPDSGSAHSP
jgi:glutamyl-Q tRNA(Asp) synthetase